MTQPQGANLKTIEWGGPGAPRTVLLVHGLTGRAEGFRSFDGEDGEASTLPQASPVIPGGFLRWICVDRRPSGAITGRESGIPEHARDLLALVGREGLEQVVLVGHLVGARVGVYLAAHHPCEALGPRPHRRRLRRDRRSSRPIHRTFQRILSLPRSLLGVSQEPASLQEPLGRASRTLLRRWRLARR